MKRIMTLLIVLSIPCLVGVSYAGDTPLDVLFAGQDMPVGTCGVFATPNPDQWQVCVNCSLTNLNSSVDNAWCGEEVKWDTGVETDTDSVITITQTKKNNPIPGQFPYRGPFIDGNGLANSDECYTSFFDCALAEDACSGEEGPIGVAIHADIFNEDMNETAWAAECLQSGSDGILGCQEWGTEFAGKNWATYVHVPCDTGLPGECASGVLSCGTDDLEPYPYCASINAEPEVCDGIDNDCDGVIDNDNPGGDESCSTGAPGECSTGITQCFDGNVICAFNEECDSCYSHCVNVLEYDVQICRDLYPSASCESNCLRNNMICVFNALFSSDFGRIGECYTDLSECFDYCEETPNYPLNPEYLVCAYTAINSFNTCTTTCY